MPIIKKNLLIVSRSTVFHNKSGGLETQLDNLITSLKSRFYITVLTTKHPEYSGNINQIKIIQGVEYIFLNNTIPGENGFSLYENLLWQIPIKRNYKSLNKNFRKISARYFKYNLTKKYNLIISQSSAASYFKLNKNQKLFLVYHGTTINELKSRYAGLKNIKDFVRFLCLDLPELLYEYLFNNPTLFKKANKIILVSKLLKKDFITQHKKFEKKVIFINNSIDTNKFVPAEKYKTPTVIFFGRINFEKGIDSFARVAKKMPNINFKVFGSGTDEFEFKKFIKKENIVNLKYYGEVDNTQISDVLSKSHIFLFLTKRKEGFPMSVLESISCGVVVVTTLDLSKINKNFPYINVKNEDEAVLEINKFIKNKELLENQSKIARNFAVSNYSLLTMCKRYEKILY